MESLAQALAGTAVIATIAVLSARHYDHRDARYADGKARRGPSMSSFRYAYPLLRFSTIGIALACFWFDHGALLELHHSPALLATGLLTALLGLGLFVWSKRTLGRAYSPCYDVWIPDGIVRTGPYRRVRHPIYTANIALLAGLATATGSLWLVANTLVLAAYYAWSARIEERALRAAIPAYAEYGRATGAFLPRAWS